MTKLVWGNPAERYFEVGVEKVVLYPTTGPGVAWNGVVSIEEANEGGDPTAYYIDGVKFRNESSVEEFALDLSAYTYPEEFLHQDGLAGTGNGLYYDNQDRAWFGLAYRTLIGNAVDGQEHAYKLHIVYNCLAGPSNNEYSTIDEEIEPSLFSWSITTTPLMVPGRKPTSHIVLDSRTVGHYTMEYIEEILYGWAEEDARLPQPNEISNAVDNPPARLQVQIQSNGLNALRHKEPADLRGRIDTGLYRITSGSRFEEGDF